MKNLKLVETASEIVQNDYTTVYGFKENDKVIIKRSKTEPNPNIVITLNVPLNCPNEIPLGGGAFGFNGDE